MSKSIFDELDRLYSEIDALLNANELAARAKGLAKREQSYQQKRRLNDQSCFLFMFSRLEGWIKEQSNELIDNKHTALSKWSQKRVWDILYKRMKEDNLHFLDRVGLLVPLNGPDYASIRDYYKERNSIAHGGSFTIVISMPTVIAKMKHLYAAVRH